MRNICRESVFNYSFTKRSLSSLARGTCFSILIIPAMFFSCSKTDLNQKISTEHFERHEVKSSHLNYGIEVLDAFFFTDDANCRLDCYQRFESPQETYNLASGSGQKTLFLIANSRRERYDWTDIRNLNTISDICVNLEDERLDYPILTSLHKTTAGAEIALNMEPLTCEITLRSIACNFSGKPYSNERFTLKRIFLTYVNATSSIVPEANSKQTRIINAGLLDEHHLKQFHDRDIIVLEFDQTIEIEPSILNRSLYCYENYSSEESIGSPYTRLVIEGQIGENTYYYPIRINAANGGVKRGCRYIFDITLTRLGLTSPDGDLDEGEIQMIMQTEPWKEKDWYSVGF